MKSFNSIPSQKLPKQITFSKKNLILTKKLNPGGFGPKINPKKTA